MTEETAPRRIAIEWSIEARADLRAIERRIAMQILHCIDDYIARRVGDVKKLGPPRTDYRLRCRGLSCLLRLQRPELHQDRGWSGWKRESGPLDIRVCWRR